MVELVNLAVDLYIAVKGANETFCICEIKGP